MGEGRNASEAGPEDLIVPVLSTNNRLRSDSVQNLNEIKS